MKLVTSDQEILPVRGLIPAQNVNGKPYATLTIKRWVRINRIVFKTPKIDLLVTGSRRRLLPDLLEHAGRLDTRLSMRTDCATPPQDLASLKDAGLYDVFLCPPAVDTEHLDAWFQACREAGFTVRLQFQAPFDPDLDVVALAERVADAGVAVTNVALTDPFLKRPRCRNETHSRATVDRMNALAAALGAHDVESNLLGLPLCLVTEENLVRGANTQQFFSDHQHYNKGSYDMAARLYQRGPIVTDKALLILLTMHTLHYNPVDVRLFPWLLHRPWVNARLALWRRLTRHKRFLRSVPKAIEDTVEAYEREIAKLRAQKNKELGPKCSACRLRRICDHETAEFRRMLPGMTVAAQGGEDVVSARQFTAQQRKYYDPIDKARAHRSESQAILAQKARNLVINRPPDRVLGSLDYSVEGMFFDPMEGGIRWFSVTNTEKLSTPLVRTQPPLTIAVTVAGGMADYIGFSLGRHCKLVCPMEAYQHEVALHVEPDGHYVLMRDRAPVRPTEFEGAHMVPVRLAGVLEPRISLWNIEGSIVTQHVRIWQGEEPTREDLCCVKYSVIIICTRYTRRLQAALRSIAHQQAFDLKKLEIVIAYVPGIDSNDDLIDSFRHSYPCVRIVRVPFAEGREKAKGFMINESLPAASGEWIVLMDADTVLPPEMFAKVDEASETANVIAPDGRKMLPPDVTGKILMGEIEPWEQWQELLKGPGEYRRREAKSVPIGFFQCVRRSCIEEVKYLEVEHFEWADMKFGIDLQEKFGPETRLSGLPVLHLDHAGSQWYGTQKHF